MYSFTSSIGGKVSEVWSSVFGYYIILCSTYIFLGCAFAVDKEFFHAVGGYDAAMNIWGGENVEQSIRVGRM